MANLVCRPQCCVCVCRHMGNPGHRWPGAEETLPSLQPVSFSHIVLCTCDLSKTTTFSIQQVVQVSPPFYPLSNQALSPDASLGKEPLPTQTASARKWTGPLAQYRPAWPAQPTSCSMQLPPPCVTPPVPQHTHTKQTSDPGQISSRAYTDRPWRQ